MSKSTSSEVRRVANLYDGPGVRYIELPPLPIVIPRYIEDEGRQKIAGNIDRNKESLNFQTPIESKQTTPSTGRGRVRK